MVLEFHFPSLARRAKPGGRVALALVCAVFALCLSRTLADDSKPAAGIGDGGPKKELFRGKVVLLADALKQRKVSVYDEDIADQVVLETVAGELIPIVADWRGRAFHQDKRLRERQVELVGYRPEGTPYLKILMVFTFDEEGRRQYTDYWCDICAIPMYEIQRCECCQGPIRLRFQPQELPAYLDLDEQPAGRNK